MAEKHRFIPVVAEEGLRQLSLPQGYLEINKERLTCSYACNRGSYSVKVGNSKITGHPFASMARTVEGLPSM